MIDEKELKRLRTIEACLSRDLRGAYKKYFPDQPFLRLSLRNFFDLLVTKGKVLGAQEATKKMSQKEFKKRLELAIVRVLAPRKKEIQEALSIPVLIRGNDKSSILKYSATALRGAVKTAKGASPEDAYEKLKSFLQGVIATKPESMVHLRAEHMKEYEKAAPLVEEEVDGFIVRARVGA